MIGARAQAVALAMLAFAAVADPKGALGAQSAPRATARGEALRISILTFGPGDDVFERFGHNAIRVRDSSTGTDLAYNWGMFSFEDPNFIPRFLSGDTRYWVEAFPTRWLLSVYAERDRESVEQVLALTPAQRAAVAAFVEENALPQNRYYRYDYFRDNCSTRVRDVIDRALDGSLGRRFTPMRTEWTYRSESVRLTTPDAFAQAGIDIALGPRADLPMSAWESMFIPMRLRDYLREVTVPAARGTTPLVAAETLLYKARRAPEATARRGLTLGAWGPILGAWILLLVPVGVAGRRRTRIPAAMMAAIWYAVTGGLGVALLGMWLGSAHVFWYRNLNLLLLSPLGLVAAIPAARAILRGAATPLARRLVLATVAQAALACAAALVASQRLAGPLLLLLPAHLGLAFAFWRHTRESKIAGRAVSDAAAVR